VVQYAVGVPTVGPFADLGLVRELAAETEAAGWDGFFVWDHLLYRDNLPTVDGWMALGIAAAITTRVRLGLLVAALPREHPGEVAKRAASIDQLSDGRLVLGAGLGSIAADHSAFGDSVTMRERGERLDESLDVICGLFTGEPFAYDGRHFHVDAPAMLPRPVQQPRPPIWIGGGWPRRAPFRRAARYDGVMPIRVGLGRGETMPVEELRELVEFVRAERADSTTFDVAIEGTTGAAADDARRVASYVDVGLTWWIEGLGWWRGDASDAHARVAAGPPR
jgi:alkanesulfonate monooxygenase SsuD/methylene tetrahydromethanopterin reductase-like flavin-dependent oxidoreductase (luciferase family)